MGTVLGCVCGCIFVPSLPYYGKASPLAPLLCTSPPTTDHLRALLDRMRVHLRVPGFPSFRPRSIPLAMTATFLDLPTEVIILTLCHLPLRELVACKRLCRRVRALIERSKLLQYHLRIMRSGVEDLFVPGICSSEFLKRLEQWEMAWWKLDLGERFARHKYHNILWTVEHIVQNGHIAAMRLGDSSWHTAPGWSYADISHVLLQGDEAPQEDSWKDIQLDRSITPKGYVLDINQDLVAVVY